MHVRHLDIRNHDLGLVERIYRGDHGELARVRFGPGATGEQWDAARRETTRLGFDPEALEEVASLLRPRGGSPATRAAAAPRAAPAPAPLAAPPTSPAAPAAQQPDPPSLDALSDRAFAPGSQWGSSRRAATAPKPSVSPGVAGAENDPLPDLSPDATAFEKGLDPDAVYSRWNAWMNPGKPKPSATREED